MMAEGTGAAVAVAATLAMAQQTAAVATAGAGKNGGGRRKKRQRWQTKINQKSAAIAAEMVIVVGAEMAATETAAAETVAGAGGSVDSGRGGDRCDFSDDAPAKVKTIGQHRVRGGE